MVREAGLQGLTRGRLASQLKLRLDEAQDVAFTLAERGLAFVWDRKLFDGSPY